MANHLFESITIVLGQADFDVSPKEDTIKIANVCFGAGPGGGDYRNYLLERINDLEWVLWVSITDEWSEKVCLDEENDVYAEPKPLYALQATAKTKDLVPAEIVATEILKATWIKERQQGYNTNFDSFTVDDPGLLSKEQLKIIINATSSEDL